MRSSIQALEARLEEINREMDRLEREWSRQIEAIQRDCRAFRAICDRVKQ